MPAGELETPEKVYRDTARAGKKMCDDFLERRPAP